MAGFRVDFKGVKELKANIERFANNAAFSVGRELFREGEGIITDAKLETPVDTGALRASGHVRPPVIEGAHVTVELGFGGPAASYAVFVHENLQARHTVGKAKYLEDPFKRRIPEFLARLGGRVSSSFTKIGK